MPHLSTPTVSISSASASDTSTGISDSTREKLRRGTSEPEQVNRVNSADLFGAQREIEIDHEGRIYRLRLTHLNKLILTA